MSFATIPIGDIRTDCRHYSGYKPCNKHDGCPDCPHYAARGEQLLVIKLGAMGDVLRTKALLPALKRAHPNSWIVWLTNPGSESIARDPLVDEVRTYTPEGLGALEGRHFARVLSLDKDAHAVALSARVSADLRQGFAPTAYNTITVWNRGAEEALRLGLSDEFKFRRNRKTMPHIVHDIAELPYDGATYALTIPDAARREADAAWRALALPPKLPTIGINTGCGPVFATKGWTAANMAELLRHMGIAGDVSLVLLGGPREEQLHRELLRAAGGLAGTRVFNAGNDHKLETFFALIEKCDAVLSADTLAMHVAIALRRPLVAYFGPTCEQEIDLFGLGEKIVTDFACAPCYLKTCPHARTCMDALAPETVEAALRRVLARASR